MLRATEFCKRDMQQPHVYKSFLNKGAATESSNQHQEKTSNEEHSLRNLGPVTRDRSRDRADRYKCTGYSRSERDTCGAEPVEHAIHEHNDQHRSERRSYSECTAHNPRAESVFDDACLAGWQRDGQRDGKYQQPALGAASRRSSGQCERHFDDLACHAGQHGGSPELRSFQLEQHDHVDHQFAAGSGCQLGERQHRWNGLAGYAQDRFHEHHSNQQEASPQKDHHGFDQQLDVV